MLRIRIMPSGTYLRDGVHGTKHSLCPACFTYPLAAVRSSSIPSFVIPELYPSPRGTSSRMTAPNMAFLQPNHTSDRWTRHALLTMHTYIHECLCLPCLLRITLLVLNLPYFCLLCSSCSGFRFSHDAVESRFIEADLLCADVSMMPIYVAFIRHVLAKLLRASQKTLD